MDAFPVGVKFRYPWRPYQQRVLKELLAHLADGHLHIVAAPGSGKTALGLEVMVRLNKPTLILAPTLTIRDQWIDRFADLFLHDGGVPDWISCDLRHPGLLTVATYQSLHAACVGRLVAESRDEDEDGDPAAREDSETAPEAVSATSAFAALTERKVATLVLDEAHHLRTEWWRALQILREQLPGAAVVALTATPPYDVSPAEWERYVELCGPVDAEVPVPELVLTGDLCFHQDYVRFSTPSAEEIARIRSFKQQVATFTAELLADADFQEMIARHLWVLEPQRHVEAILEDAQFFSSLLIFLSQVGAPIRRETLEVLGARRERLPELSQEWLEILLTGCLFRFRETFARREDTLRALEHRLSRIGALVQGRVCLRTTERIERSLTTSTSKLDSIVSIAELESMALGPELRMVVLTDFIRAADLPSRAGECPPLTRLGVVPMFEALRRADKGKLRLGVLSGSLVIVPETCRERLSALATGEGIPAERIRLRPLDHDPRYIRLEVSGSGQAEAVRLVTTLFSEGAITALVGTKSLLGEGWDAPSINCLVMASFVGSYMLSNQMRGRAIRAQSGLPDKTANVWHLICVDPEASDPSDDLATLTRRFRAFLGVSFLDPVIESGIERLGLGVPPYTPARIAEINRQMAEHARDRAGLRRSWQNALQNAVEGLGAVEELRAAEGFTRPWYLLTETIAALAWEGILLGGFVTSEVARGLSNIRVQSLRQYLLLLAAALLVGVVVAAPRLIKALWLLLRYGPVEGSMKQIGEAVLAALRQAGIVRGAAGQLKVAVKRGPQGMVRCALDGGTGYEMSAFVDALEETLAPVENPRYLLVRNTWLGLVHRTDYHAVPSVIGRKKELAEFLSRVWRKLVGPTELIFTRSVEGRTVLLRARVQSLAAKLQGRPGRTSCWR
jgi:superfamily II DNA or RNA helicase